MKPKWNVWLPIVLMVVLAVTRWPGLLPPNFSAVYALLFCAGVYLPGRLGWWLPLATMGLTDLALNLFYYDAPLVSVRMLGTYLVYPALIWFGKKLGPGSSFLALLGGGLVGAIVFYLVSNTISWLTDPAYLKTIAGWIQALTVGTPGLPPTWEFFRNTLLSGGLFTGLFVGTMKASEAAESAREKEAPEADEEDAPAAEPQEAKS